MLQKIHSDSVPPVPSMPVKQPIPPGQNIKLTRKGVQQLLHKSVFLTCAHEGFDSKFQLIYMYGYWNCDNILFYL